jgi:hypothetical protein
MKKTLQIFLLTGIALLFSCEDQGLFIICEDCNPNEPVRTELTAKVDQSLSQGIVISLYEGTLEDNILIGTYNIYSETFTQEVTINKQYTLTATYNISGKKYIAVDSALPRVRYDTKQCEEPCYFVFDKVCDLRLKFTK